MLLLHHLYNQNPILIKHTVTGVLDVVSALISLSFMLICYCYFAVLFSAGRELEGDSRGYRSAEEQARELTRSIRREVNKLSEKWNALIDRSDQWQRKLDDSLAVSQFPFS
jgi:uncharacterized protein YlxW (UPF0749 family)